MNDMLELRRQLERFGDDVLCDCARWCVDLSHIEANIPCHIGQFLAGFVVDLSVKPFASGEPVVGWCDKDIALVIPDVASDNS